MAEALSNAVNSGTLNFPGKEVDNTPSFKMQPEHHTIFRLETCQTVSSGKVLGFTWEQPLKRNVMPLKHE